MASKTSSSVGSWVTINGVHVLIGANGKITKGPARFIGSKVEDLPGGKSTTTKTSTKKTVEKKKTTTPKKTTSKEEKLQNSFNESRKNTKSFVKPEAGEKITWGKDMSGVNVGTVQRKVNGVTYIQKVAMENPTTKEIYSKGNTVKSSKTGVFKPNENTVTKVSKAQTPKAPKTKSAVDKMIDKGQTSSAKTINLYTGKTIQSGSIKKAGVDPKTRQIKYTAKDQNGKTIVLDGADMGAVFVMGIDTTFYN